MIKNRLQVVMRAFVLSLLVAPTAALAEVDAAIPQDRVFFTYHHFHSVSEAVYMVIGVARPGNAISGNTIVTHHVTVRDPDGEVLGQFSAEAPAAGFAEVTFAVSVEGGDLNHFANDQRLGPVALDPKIRPSQLHGRSQTVDDRAKSTYGRVDSDPSIEPAAFFSVGTKQSRWYNQD